MRNTRGKKALVMLPKVTKFFKNSDVIKMPSKFEAEPYKVLSKKRNNVTVQYVISVKLLM